MESFLNQLFELIAEQDLSVVELIGALEMAKAELLNASMDDNDET